MVIGEKRGAATENAERGPGPKPCSGEGIFGGLKAPASSGKRTRKAKAEEKATARRPGAGALEENEDEGFWKTAPTEAGATEGEYKSKRAGGTPFDWVEG